MPLVGKGRAAEWLLKLLVLILRSGCYSNPTSELALIRWSLQMSYFHNHSDLLLFDEKSTKHEDKTKNKISISTPVGAIISLIQVHHHNHSFATIYE